MPGIDGGCENWYVTTVAVPKATGAAMKARDAIGLIENDGWILSRTRGDHRQYKHPTSQAK